MVSRCVLSFGFAFTAKSHRVKSQQELSTDDAWPFRSQSHYAGPTFVDLTLQAGVADAESSASSWGSNFVDIDADGDLDLYVTNVGAPNRLYLNSDGKGNFTDITVSSGLLDPSASRGAAFADVNGDGNVDLYQIGTDIPNRLYLGDGKGHFMRQFETAVEDTGMGQLACFGDVDNDGDLDLFITNYDKSNILYLNDGRGEFVDVTQEYGLVSPPNSGGFQCEFGDIDDDGDLDLFLGYTNSSNPESTVAQLMINDGTGKFVDRTEEAGMLIDKSEYGWRPQLGDFNGDGHMDVLVMAVGPNHLYLNDGTGHFTDTIQTSGLPLDGTTPGLNVADVDGDGDLDVLQGSAFSAMSFFKNDGHGIFTDATTETGLGFHIVTHGIAFGDIDGDGDLDAHISSWDFITGHVQQNRLAVQEGQPTYDWLKVRPVNENGHATLLGAQVSVFESGTQNAVGVRTHIDGGHNQGSQDGYDAFFGLGDSAGKTYDIQVRCGGPWVTKETQQELGDVRPNQVVAVTCHRQPA